jgi:endonuclease YncB( thermonuclease family)
MSVSQIASRLMLILVSLGLFTACTILVTSPLIAQVAQREAIQGIGEAKDGDTIQVGNTTIRLVGIDAPELGQLCQNKSGNSYPCGKNAKTKLQNLLSKGSLYCQTRGEDGFGRELAECWILGKGGSITNVNEVMVMAGMAFAFTKYSEEYTALEALAEQQKAGLWAGKFEFPWEYREKQKPPSAPAAPPIVMPPGGATCPPRAPYCKDITSCSRACFLLQECGFGRLDGDNDGIPCENVCRRRCS